MPLDAGAAADPANSPAFDCRTCGACCSYSAEWPRFTLESNAEISAIPASLVNTEGSGMACGGTRCAALRGVVGKGVSCAVYALRPTVCRSCVPGDDACRLARRALLGL